MQLVDPLGRITERTVQIGAKPVDPAPDVLDLQLIALGGGGINITWRSSAPPGVRAACRYRVHITLIPVMPPLMPVAPVVALPDREPLPIDAARVVEDSVNGVAAILRKPIAHLHPGISDRAALIFDRSGLIIDPICGGLKPKSLQIDMALGDIPLSGTAPPPTPPHPWLLERLNSVHGSTSYGLHINGKVSSVTERITALPSRVFPDRPVPTVSIRGPLFSGRHP